MMIELGLISGLIFLIIFFHLKQNGSISSALLKFTEQDLQLRNLKDIFQHSTEILGRNITEMNSALNQQIHNNGLMNNQRLDGFAKQISDLTKLNEIKLNNLQETIAKQLDLIRNDNSNKLEKIRETVEEKLHDTLEKRLSNSFKIISERLEIVHRSMGEMQTLASGVGDLKRVLTNIKTRGIWGEVQLDAIITQLLTPAQFEKNVKVDPSENSRVEFAIKLPGTQEDSCVWLPIDAKFPIEEYQRLMEAHESGDINKMQEQSKALEYSIKKCAKMISERYVKPPYTTDFAIMFLPIESMYAEVLRYPGLLELIQQQYRVVITSPTTLSAILNSLQMGFKTLAIHKQSSEVWKILSAVKSEFSKFSDVLAKTKMKLDQASKSISDAEVRTRVIGRKLKDVESLPNAIDIPAKDDKDLIP
jgi:DNA recombination protein RmuC